jgi:hypothetical protein
VVSEWKRATVKVDYHVQVLDHFYSAPYTLVHEEAEVRLTVATVEIFHRGQRVADRLGRIREEVVFVGGMVRSLLITDPGAPPARPTDDIDVVAAISSQSEYYALAARLRALGFREDHREKAPTALPMAHRRTPASGSISEAFPRKGSHGKGCCARGGGSYRFVEAWRTPLSRGASSSTACRGST